MKLDYPYFIDFEASSLSFDSYPIEIAWGHKKDNIESFLISPKNIVHWTDWSFESQAIHGIERDTLIQSGKDPGFICEKIYSCLDNKLVYSDAAPFDMDWLGKLYEATGMSLPNFTIRDINELLIAELSSPEIHIENLTGHINNLKLKHVSG